MFQKNQCHEFGLTHLQQNELYIDQLLSSLYLSLYTHLHFVTLPYEGHKIGC